MSGSPNSNSAARRALFYGLDDSLASPLKTELSRCNCKSTDAPAQGSTPRADIVFCPPAPDLLRAALARFRGLPVVVVSRLPEVDGWLNALEDGAADYCAAPFEAIHLRWLLETHTRPRRVIAA